MRLASTAFAFCAVLLASAFAVTAQSVITVGGDPSYSGTYSITLQTGTFDQVYGTTQGNSPAPSLTPWWNGENTSGPAQSFATAYATQVSPIAQAVYFAYSVTGNGNNFRYVAAQPKPIGGTPQTVSGNLPRGTGSYMFARAVKIPEIDGAVLGRVVMSLGVLHLCLLGLKRRRAAI